MTIVTLLPTDEEILCDDCNENYGNSDAKGGIMFGRKAICPKCEPSWRRNAAKYHEEHYIKEIPGITFKELVLKARRREI